MSFPGLAPPPFFLATPGRPPLPWGQMFNVYLVASGAAKFAPGRCKATLSHCLKAEGQRIYQTLPAGSSAAAPAAPGATALADKDGDKSAAATSDEYDTALVALRHHFSTSCNVVVERHRFHRRRQHSGESVHDFVAALRELASHCSFVSQDDALRDQFVAGIASNRVRERLLLEGPSLSFESSVRIALQFEQAAEELKEFSPSVDQVSLQRRRKKPSHSLQKNDSQPVAHSQQKLTKSAGGPRAPQRNRPPERNRERSRHCASPHCFRCGSRRAPAAHVRRSGTAPLNGTENAVGIARRRTVSDAARGTISHQIRSAQRMGKAVCFAVARATSKLYAIANDFRCRAGSARLSVMATFRRVTRVAVLSRS
uniref:Putative tick transposon n=1 Tax=Rhipicephalus pulchellus TaxID=72859 RepID=L7LY19_RHIPC